MVISDDNMRNAKSIFDSQKIYLDFYSTEKLSYNIFFDDLVSIAKWLRKVNTYFYNKRDVNYVFKTKDSLAIKNCCKINIIKDPL